MPNKGFLLVQMQPPPAFEEEFNDWYDTDHIPERLAVPGFETARRFVCIDGWPRYLALYDLASLDVLDTPAYHRVSGDRFTPWTRRVLSRVRVFRATGTQHYPGDALTGDAGRLILLHFRDVHPQEQPGLLAGLRPACSAHARRSSTASTSTRATERRRRAPAKERGRGWTTSWTGQSARLHGG